MLLLFILILILPSTNAFSFQKSRFDPIDETMVYEGGAYATVGTVEFNSDTYMCQVGHATYSRKVPIWDPETRELADFTSRFTFNIDPQGRSNYAAGFAFFLAPPDFHIPPNSAGGFLGLYNLTTSNSARNRIVHVEFDTFPNQEWDPPFQHVGINNNSVFSAKSTRWNATLHAGETADVRIGYDSGSRNLSVSWKYQDSSGSGTSTNGTSTSLWYIVDLRDALPPLATVGFSASTSNVLERNVLQSWEFRSSLEINESDENNPKKIAAIIAPILACGVLISALTFAFLWKRRQRMMQGKEKLDKTMDDHMMTSINDELERGAGPKRFSYDDLATATSNFSKERKLGEGGFGEVYRGYLNELGSLVAVKKISRGSKQGRKEYVTEVKVISMLRHRNLVQLIGWCHDRGEFLLVYEFMPNGSLDSHLFGRKPALSWSVRYRIAMGLASAIRYLHEEGDQCVIHRDVKSSNIMLDSGFNVKLGDFGLARLMDHEMGLQTTGLAGTLGYLAPEYITTGRASKESDVYSFGVVCVEIATGRKASDPVSRKSGESLVEWVWDLYGAGNLILAVDEKLGTMGFDEGQLGRVLIVGLWCAHPDRNARPSIKQVIQVLNFEAPLPYLPDTMPVPTYQVAAATQSVTSSDVSCSNTLSSSIQDGR
ncbi:L-type lectin-domain containing receptor kinase IX.1 [Linum perenne]